MMAKTSPHVRLLEAAEAEVLQRRAAAELVSLGVQPGDRVAFALPSSAALLCAVLGAARIGVVPVLVNATLLDHERDQLVADVAPVQRFFAQGEVDALVAPRPEPLVDLAPYPLTRPMHFTSGTTGRAKGVWTGLWDEATARAVFDDEADLWSFGLDDVHLICSPMYHSVSLRFAAGTLLRGGSCYVVDRFDAEVALQVLRGRHGPAPTTTFLAPAALARLLAASRAEEHFASLRLLVHAGSPCTPALKEAARARLAPGVLWEFYGSTEGQFTVCSDEEWQAHPGTVGRARPGRSLSIDPDGTVWCTAPSFARFQYWGDEAKTAASWRGDAFSVGDLGRLDAEGYLYLDGRRDDLIISGGVNVYPAEVEAQLDGTGGVRELCVVGLDDLRWGQRVVAAVVVDDTQEPAAALAALEHRAEERLAPYKRPKEFVVVSELPRTATGKIQRHRLVATFEERGVGPSGEGQGDGQGEGRGNSI